MAEIDETEEEQPEPLEEEAPAETPAEEPEEAPEEEQPEERPGVDWGDDLLDESGKLLGKFKDTGSLARSYKELESGFGKKASEAAQYRKALEAAGYNLDEQGNPVKIAAEAPPPAADPAPQDAPQDPAVPAGHRMVDGVLYDHLNMPVVADEDWDALEEEDPEEAQRLRSEYRTLRLIRQEEYNRSQAQSQARHQAEVLTQTREKARSVAKNDYGLPDELVTEIEAAVDEQMKAAPPDARNSPQAYLLVSEAVAARKMAAYYQQQIKDILAGNKEATEKARKVIAVEKGTLTTPAPASSGAASLTAAERKMAKELGVSEEDYARNK